MEKNVENEEEIEVANVGDTIKFIPSWSSEHLQGTVTAVNVNSVIVQLNTPQKTEEGEYKNTVVNHKNYSIITQNS